MLSLSSVTSEATSFSCSSSLPLSSPVPRQENETQLGTNKEKAEEKAKNLSNKRSKNKSIMNSFVDTMKLREKEKVHIALAKFFFGCNISFSVIESVHFKKFIQTIRPSYKLPCRKTLSTVLLDKVHEEILVNNKNNASPYASLLIDGWKNSSNNTNNVTECTW